MARNYEESVGPDANLTPPINKSKLSVERRRLFARVEEINHAWLDSMREMRRAEAEFSIRLFSCEKQEDAMALCDEWLAKRQQIIAAEKEQFEKSWAALMSLLAQPTTSLSRRSKVTPSEQE